jgi:hypothetical protein
VLSGWLLTTLTLWLIAAGRWGSYVGWPAHSVYITDVTLMIVGLLLVRTIVKFSFLKAIVGEKMLWPVLGLVGVAAVRLSFDAGNGLIAARDAAPYLYGAVAVLVLATQLPCRLGWALELVTALHSGWVTIALVDPSFNDAFPLLGRTQVLELRTDFDACVAGVLAVACILGISRSASAGVNTLKIAVAIWSAALVPAMNNRAGLLASVLAILWAAVLIYRQQVRSRGLNRRRRGQLVAAVLGLAIVLAGAVVTYTPAGQRLVGTFEQASSPEAKTTNARLAVYRLVFDYIDESPTRVAVGVGFGPDYLKKIGATPIYDPGGTLRVRSPHNFLLGTYARLGILGGLLQLVVIVLGYVLAWRALRLDPTDDLARLAALLLVALPVAAAVGVVLESPFGAVPYFWAYGVLVLRLRRLANTRDAPTGGRSAELDNQGSRALDEGSPT